ncbi:MAG: hypothetical protein K8R88_14505 [Armatimonadetes bacterium]|nr:hypothetical protein [Armatimonadota bacterium]
MRVVAYGILGLSMLMSGGAVLHSSDAPAKLPGLTFVDISGKKHSTDEYRGKPLLIAMTSATCPVSKRYGPMLARLEKQVNILFVNPTEAETPKEMNAMIASNGWKGRYAPDAKFAGTLGARSTAEVFLYNENQVLVYRGAVNDQYGVGVTKPAPTANYLEDALAALKKGDTPPVKITEAPGCLLAQDGIATKIPLTYYNQISRIVQNKCGSCHRDGGVAPFALDSYESVKSRSAMLASVIKTKQMPPWFASDPEPGHESPWKGDLSLSAEEREQLLEWLGGKKPAGDPKDAPKPLVADKTWKIGKPDLIVQIPSPIDIKADGYMEYENILIDPKITEDKWVEALNIEPTDRSVVHHVLVFLLPPNYESLTPTQKQGIQLQAVTGFFAGYVPGLDHADYGAGFAKKLPAGSKFLFQIHYTPNGKATRDQVKLGLRYAKAEVKHEVVTKGALKFQFAIPPGAPNHMVTANLALPAGAKVISMIPHMHLRGKAAKYELVSPDGSMTTLLDVPKYDFNWQLRYERKEPVTVERGSMIKYTAWYDNSKDNPANPDPTKTVRWGDQTFNEMMLGYVEYYVP